MSIAALATAWNDGPDDAGSLLLLMSLADGASSESGRGGPVVSTVALDRLTDRARCVDLAVLFDRLDDLVACGHLISTDMSVSGQVTATFAEQFDEPLIAPGTRRKRRPIPFTTRVAVYRRDGYGCVTCGAGTDLTLDHIHPRSLGGADTEDNLQTMCRPCNSRKGARVPDGS